MDPPGFSCRDAANRGLLRGFFVKNIMPPKNISPLCGERVKNISPLCGEGFVVDIPLWIRQDSHAAMRRSGDYYEDFLLRTFCCSAAKVF